MVVFSYYPYSWKDLIVGAPFYFDRKKDKGGAVYVYMNQNGSFGKKADVVLTGNKDSAFGMAVVAIGDVNQDGFQGRILYLLSTSNMYLAFISLLLMCWLFAIIHFCVQCSE